jgi:hypothetical protein
MMGKYTMNNGADFYAQNGSTEFKVITSTGDVVAGKVHFGNSTANTAIGSTGLLYSNGAPINYAETLYYSSAGLNVSTTPAYGLTYVQTNSTGGDFSVVPAVLTIAAPIPGVRKTIVLDSTIAAVNNLDLYLGASVDVLNSSNKSTDSGANYIAFSSIATMTQVVTLCGLTTALWCIESAISGSSVGSSAGFGEPAGIRAMTTCRTS